VLPFGAAVNEGTVKRRATVAAESRDRASKPVGKHETGAEMGRPVKTGSPPFFAPVGETHVVENKWSAENRRLLSHDVIHNTCVTPEIAEWCLIFSI